MTYQDWIARGPAVCDAECAEAMGLIDCGPSGWWTDDTSPELIGPLPPAYTSDRNHAAMMVERVVERGRARIVSLHGYLRDHVVFDDDLPNSIFWLRINSAIIAWACWRVLKEEA